MRKKIVVFGLCLSLVLTSVTACSKNKKKTKTSESVTSSKTDSAASDEETVSVSQADLAGKETEFTTKINYIAQMGDKFVADNRDMLTYFMFSQLSIVNDYDSASKVTEDLKKGIRTSNIMSSAFAQVKNGSTVGENEEAFNAYYDENKKPYEEYAQQNSTDLATILQQMGYQSEDEYKESVKSQFEDYNVLAKIAKDNNLTVTQKEYDTLVNAIVVSEDGYATVEEFEKQVSKQRLVDSMMINKAYYYIAKNVKVIDDSAEAADKTTDESEVLEVNTEIPEIGGDSETLAYSTYDVDVTLADISAITVPSSTANVTKLSLQRAISVILNSTDFKLDNVEKKEGKVENYDIVNIDYTGRLDGKIFSGGEATGYNLVIGSNSFIDGFEEGLIGKEVGSTEVLNLKFPDDYGQAAAAQSTEAASEEETTVTE